MITAEDVEAISGIYLSPRYDQPQPTPDFHRAAWELYCSPVTQAAVAAPRNHAKSTALTHDFIIATAVMRDEPYIILVGSTEDKAIEHLGDIALELRENEELRRDFKIRELVQDQKTDIIVECVDGYQFRILARGAEQKIRGTKWHGRRPGLIVGDDLEDDEQVASRDRRTKLKHWFFRACKQALRDGGRIRDHGTILHYDSLLNNLMRHPGWATLKYKAHESFTDFSNILWPEKFPERRLRAIQAEFIFANDGAGYSCEYLNDPHDSNEAYLTRDQFIPLDAEESAKYWKPCAAWDFAVSKKDKANRSACVVGGKTVENFLHFRAFYKGRWDSKEIVDKILEVQRRWKPEFQFVEDGVIWQALEPILREEMLREDVWVNFVPIKSVQDKATRGRSYQKRMKAGTCRYDTEAEGYEDYQEECLLFTGVSEAMLDDQFDAGALLARGVERMIVDEEDAVTEEDLVWLRQSAALRAGQGRSKVTGY